MERHVIMLGVVCLVSFATEVTAASQVNLSDRLPLQTLIIAVNDARSEIRSGEIHMTTSTTHYPTVRDQQEKERLLAEQKRSLVQKLGEPQTDEERLQLEQHLREAELALGILDGISLVEEESIAFEIYGVSPIGTDPSSYRYRIIRMDRSERDMYSFEAEFTHAGMYTILYYDGEMQTREAESRLLKSTFTSKKSDRIRGFLPWHLFGRSRRRIPGEGTIYLGVDSVSDNKCHVLQYPFGEGASTRLWICPSLGFCCLREELYRGDRLVYCHDYSSFREFEGTWYPTRYSWVRYDGSGSVSSRMEVHIHDARFAVAFPSDFFSLDSEAILASHLTIEEDSETFQIPGRLSHSIQNNNEATEHLSAECGPRALLEVCRIYGIPATFEEIAELAEYHVSAGVSMLGLKRAALEKGLAATGVSTSMQVLSRTLPAIVHVNGDHFVVVKAVSNGKVSVYDPNGEYTIISEEEFSEIWAGSALLFQGSRAHTSVKPAPKNSGSDRPVITFEQRIFDFGAVESQAELEHTFIFRNTGNAPLQIRRVDSSCRCTITLSTSGTTSPGENGEIEVTVHVGSNTGLIQNYLDVYSNDPVNPKLRLTIRADVFTPVVVKPSRVMFGTLLAGETQRRDVHLAIDKPGVELSEVRSSSEHIVVELAQSPAIHGCLMKVVLRETAPVGSLNGRITVVYLDNGQERSMEIPVWGEVMGDISVVPRAVFLGAVGSAMRTSRKTVNVRTRSAKILVNGVVSESEYINAVCTPVMKTSAYNMYEVSISIGPNLPPGNLSTSLVLRTNSRIQPEVVIPLHGVKVRE